jgi:hypothetical protein
MSQTAICNAINSKKLIEFYYSGDAVPGTRTVEPHMVAYNSRNNLALSAWFLGGTGESQTGQGWREYLLSDMTSVVTLSQKFSGPRPGYKPDGGKTFHNVQCKL